MDQDLIDVESLTLCSFCKQKFNATDHCPKILTCKHYFCLKCIKTSMVNGPEVSCVDCWKNQSVIETCVESLPTHKPVLSLAHHLTTLGFCDADYKPKKSIGCGTHGLSWTLWCHSCQKPLCRMCFLLIEHSGHHVTSHEEASQLFHNEMQSELALMAKILQEIRRLGNQQREFQLRVLEACMTMKSCMESDLAAAYSIGPEIKEAADLLLRARGELCGLTSPSELHAAHLNITAEKQKLENRFQDLVIQSRVEELVSRSNTVLDFAAITGAYSASDWLRSGGGPNSPAIKPIAPPHPILLLANYCMYQLHGRAVNKTTAVATLIRNPLPSVVQPRYFFTIESNQVAMGRFVIETRPDLAPKMSHNFAALCLAETGPSYRHCTVFQCWEGESIITGDYETNTGRGGRAVYDEGYFMPDETKIPAVRGAVGMRRTQKRHDNLGLVGSQFRVILQDMRGFSAIFGHVVEGIELVEKIASCGDQTGKPTKTIVITGCGQL